MGDKYTDAQKKASIKYLKEKTDSIQIRVPKGTKDRWRVAATERGKSLNQFIAEAVEKEITEEHRKPTGAFLWAFALPMLIVRLTSQQGGYNTFLF